MKLCLIETHWGKRADKPKDEQYSGIGYYRIVKPAEYLAEAGHDVDWWAKDFSDAITKTDEVLQNTVDFFTGYDAVIMKPTDNFNAAKAIVAALDYLKIPLIIDYDDNYLEIAESNPAIEGGYRKGDKERMVFLTLMSFADAIFCSTKPLADYYTEVQKKMGFEKDIFVLPNCNVIEEWEYRNTEPTDRIVIGWHGSISHNDDLAMVFPAILDVMKKNDNVYLLLVGGATIETLEPIAMWPDRILDRVAAIKGTPCWKGFPEYLMDQPFNIGLAPLVDDVFNKGKSHIKWMELAMKKIPCIASDVYPYREPVDGTPAIEHGETGYLVKTKKEWVETLQKLIDDKDLRKKIGDNAYNAVKKDWQYKDHIKKWDNAIQKVVEGAR